MWDYFFKLTVCKRRQGEGQIPVILDLKCEDYVLKLMICESVPLKRKLAGGRKEEARSIDAGAEELKQSETDTLSSEGRSWFRWFLKFDIKYSVRLAL